MQIEIMTMNGCGPCKQLKNLLDEKGVEYTLYNAEDRGGEGAEIKKIMMEGGYRAVPCVLIDREVVGVGTKAIDVLKEKGVL